MGNKREYECPYCKKMGKTGKMRLELDRLICDNCDTQIDLETKNPIPRWIADIQANAENNFSLLRPPFTQLDLAFSRLYSLYREAYFNVLFGMYNAGIVLLGVLLEAVTKEIIYSKEGKEFQGDFGKALGHAREKHYLQTKDYFFLDDFRKNIRNIYQHSDVTTLLKGLFVPAWKIKIGKDIHKDLSNALKDIKNGKIKPSMMPAWQSSISEAVKGPLDQKHAINLFNKVHDFLIGAKIRYFKLEK